MPKAQMVINSALDKITPSQKQKHEMDSAIKKILSATEIVISPYDLGHTLAGSFLRDTWLTDKLEFDVFILFPPIVSREKLEKMGLDLGKKIVTKLNGKYKVAYAEHPYIRATIGKYSVDIVPCYDIKNPVKIKSAVDRTPHHNKFILKYLQKKQSGEVRLLKQFTKGIGVYGSDLKVQGFSGYLVELLIIQYKTFSDLINEASKWNAGGVLIDLEHHLKKDEIDIKEKYPQQPLIVIDPVDRNRNVAAALSPANFELFKHSCIEFLKKPDVSFFSLNKTLTTSEALKKLVMKRDTKLITIQFPRPDVVDDVIYPQLRRTSRRLSSILDDSEFRVIGKGSWCDDSVCVLFFELEVWKLPQVRKVVGPPVFAYLNAKQFISKYTGNSRLWVDGNSWVTEVKRKYSVAGDLLENIIKQDKKKLAQIGIASYVSESLNSTAKIFEDVSVIRKAVNNLEFREFLTDYFKKKII